MSSIVVLAAVLASHTAHAANYTAADETQLRAAIQAANGDADPTSAITLLNNVTLASTAAFPVFTKPITIDTGSFALIGVNATAAATGGSLTFGAGSQLTAAGSLIGGKGGDAFRANAGAGGAGASLAGGTLTNRGTISGGQGGVTDAGGSDGFATTIAAGAGGTGVVMNSGSFVNEGRIAGGNGGSVIH